ncbi:MAG: hypothetical protein ACO35E_02985 [Ilumatobacteraceae bacterium]
MSGVRAVSAPVRRRRSDGFGLLVTCVGLSALLASCDTDDGRRMREPSVPYVAPTDPPASSTP